ncbi:rhodanese-like domain-containing protein [Rhodoferax ferrireducens]|uniref:rhodanese-like domain-containing protein n=1 Tax=Rhodoferax ferrireducens TaxID=192843 RepID=UPI000E0DAD43|nr:rhodanese-like domain-containing protein [Rhodoferax ferrireducens]
MKFTAWLAAFTLACGLTSTAHAADPEYLRIIGTDTKFVAKNAKGEETVITRVMTPCAKNKGWIQAMVPVAGVHPVGEIEILNAMNDRDALLVDMREPEDRANGTIAGSMHIVYTEVAGRLNELGCTKVAGKWDCSKAKKVYAFCNGPACPQSPSAIQAMTREGFPAERIYYYRGGMLDWSALGFPVVKGDF